MAQNVITQTISLITSDEVIHLSEVPDDLLDAWITDINNNSGITINIFNEIYEGHKEMQGINPAIDDHDRAEYRAQFERLLRIEKARRLRI